MRIRFAHYERCQNAFEKAWMKVCDAAFYGGKKGSIKREAASDAMWNWPDGWWEYKEGEIR
jgi:hypothetical protein